MRYIIHSNPEDIDVIFSLYDAGTELQKIVAKKHWQGFDRELIATDIREKRCWKIMEDDQMACVFSITFQDPFIWKEKDNDPAIYIHRISTHPNFRGKGYVNDIVRWAKEYAAANGKAYIRMDTGSGNDKLNNYYISCGFNYLGVVATVDSEDLPAHYKGGTSSLFEIQL
ncbi:GNAT family N-acetyltransferase [Chitinophaga arvensicola]|uniref:Acetyltransferase (GNAT) domain-containing protein n=1 Tax=Chitinophaga arvensicola TaxID=29529 RepID=A0A1I0QBU0_9BACT|nr:GNAT family N-acetyltransferase [Chitinophaga arvensicola]SEW24455.1 Acetyltransferase (GNAT) domain-containing protein [Chitinophaga arvensicola]